MARHHSCLVAGRQLPPFQEKTTWKPIASCRLSASSLHFCFPHARPTRAPHRPPPEARAPRAPLPPPEVAAAERAAAAPATGEPGSREAAGGREGPEWAGAGKEGPVAPA